MQVPPEIQALARRGLDKAAHHPGHHLDWRTRRAIYHRTDDDFPAHSATVHGWLAIVTAEHVLPVFTRTFPEDDLPARLVALARRVARGEVSRQEDEVAALMEEGHFGTGIDATTWRGRIAFDAEHAGGACHKALLAVCGFGDGLDHLDDPGRRHLVHLPVPLEQVTDEHVGHLEAFSDTASEAALAWSRGREQRVLDPGRLLAFWRWWVEVALPAAWARV
jgi:hypothetical protein